MKTKLVLVNFLLDSKSKYVKTIGKNKNPIKVTENNQYIILTNNCIKAYRNLKTKAELLGENTEDSLVNLSYNQAIIKYSIACNKRANFLWRLVSADTITKALEELTPKNTTQILYKIGKQELVDKPTHIIYQSYDSSKLSKASNIAVLVPHYKDNDGNTKPTQAFKWCGEMIGKTKISKEVWL